MKSRQILCDGKGSIDACFENGVFRYLDADGTAMQIEVPSDQYDEGKFFIAGNDVNDSEGTTKSEMMVQSGCFGDCLTAIYNCPVPVVGAINGTAVGVGFCIVSVCDLLVASEKAKFGTPEIEVGVLGSLSFLPAMAPVRWANTCPSPAS